MDTAALPAEIATGEEFDREYVDLMVEQHERDVPLFQKTATSAQDSDVRDFANKHREKLPAHWIGRRT